MKKIGIYKLVHVKNWLSSIFAFIVLLVALLGATIRPDHSENANEQLISIAKLPPLTKVDVLLVAKNKVINQKRWWLLLANGGQEPLHETVPIDGMQLQGNRLKVKVKNTSDIEEYRYFLLADVVYPLADESLQAVVHDSDSVLELKDLYGEVHHTSNEELYQRIKEEHVTSNFYFLGTDPFGRDMLSRLMAGSYVTLIVGFLSMAISLVLGVTIGTIGGYFGGNTDRAMLWLMNVFWSIPTILIVIAITILLSEGVVSLVIGIGLVLWVEVAQVIRGVVRSISNTDYIKAAKLMGTPIRRILWHHVLPNLKGPILVLASTAFARAILLESGLNFLGVGIELPRPSWGGMIRELYGFIITDGAFLAMIPCMAIVLLVLSITNFGKNLQERYNVKYGLNLRKNLS